MTADYRAAKIIKIEPIEKFFFINWRLDIRCNFDCSYCSSEWHSLTAEQRSLEQFQSYWLKIYSKLTDLDKKIQISFTGGELTFNKNFLPFVKWLRENYHDKIESIGLSTNGSANSDYYLELIKYVDFISFSTHSEFFNERKFFENVLACCRAVQNTAKTIHVNIMDEPWHRDRIELYSNFLSVNNINFSVNTINFTFGKDHRPPKLSNPFDFDNARI